MIFQNLFKPLGGMEILMNYYGQSDIGKIRNNNQDCFGCYALAQNAYLFAVCDGMGGCAGGEIASKLALEAFSLEVQKLCVPNTADGNIALTDKATEIILSSAISSANSAVISAAAENSDLEGMGTTIVAALVFTDEQSLYALNVGDSRMYLITDSEIEQLTSDHSYVQYLVDIGKMTAEEAERSPEKNKILKSIGSSSYLKADISSYGYNINSSQYILLCSDGLTNMVQNSAIHSLVISDLTITEKVECLISLANQNGGTDNITVILAEL